MAALYRRAMLPLAGGAHDGVDNRPGVHRTRVGRQHGQRDPGISRCGRHRRADDMHAADVVGDSCRLSVGRRGAEGVAEVTS